MTCIIGLIDEDNVYIGGDSASCSVADYNYRVREDKKVFRKNGMIFGFTTSFRMGQLLQYSLTTPKQKLKESDFQFLCTSFMDSVIECFTDKNYASIENNEAAGGTFILGYKGKLYTIYDDFQVSRISKPFTACGCGEEYALGAMEILYSNKSLSAKQKIVKALKATEEFCRGVKGPFNIVKL